MPIYGWDSSDFDWDRGPMDVGAAARSGIAFFTHKATEGTKVKHWHYAACLNRARESGIPFRGAYMVPRTPGNNGHGTVAQQVDYFLSYLDAQTPWWRGDPDFFIQVDLEHWGYDDVPPWVGVEACRLLRERAGKWVVLYAPRWAYGDSIPGDDPLWASAYGNNPAVPYRQGYPGDGASAWAPYSGRVPVILQYGSKLTIGSQPGCDANAFRGSIEGFRTMITGKVPDVDLSDNINSSRSGSTSVANLLATVMDDVHMDVGPTVKRIEDKLSAGAPVTLTPEQMAELKATLPTAADIVAALVKLAAK